MPVFVLREVAGKIGEKVGVQELPEAQGGISHAVHLPVKTCYCARNKNMGWDIPRG